MNDEAIQLEAESTALFYEAKVTCNEAEAIART